MNQLAEHGIGNRVIGAVANEQVNSQAFRHMMVRSVARATSPATETDTDVLARTWRGYLAWILAAAAIGFIVAAVFAGGFRLPRNWYLVFYFGIMAGFFYSYIRWNRIDVAEAVKKNFHWGIIAGSVISIFTVRTVLMQPSSDMPQGIDLAFNLTWLGLVYGTFDAILLSVVPVHAAWKAFETRGWTASWPGRIAAGAAAIAASMLVILAYHLGYPECRGPFVLVITLGVAIQSLGYVISRSPLAPVISHIAMHIAAVLHGINSVSQLPPHY